MAKKTALLCAAFLLLAFCGALHGAARDAALYDQMIRLHVIAASDGEEDQALKLKVRDAVLEKVSLLTAEAKDRSEALSLLSERLAEVQQCAKETVLEQGHTDPVSVSLGEEAYGQRAYEGFMLPAGRYASVQVRIGAGAGKNWWCVLFPPLCTGTAEVREEMTEAGFTRRQVRILTEQDNPRYILKFKAVEWYDSLRSKLR